MESKIMFLYSDPKRAIQTQGAGEQIAEDNTTDPRRRHREKAHETGKSYVLKNLLICSSLQDQ